MDRNHVINVIPVYKPYQGPYKVYIIPEADIMTVQAQNALLKTIEEPPQYAVFILLTENADVLLPTINSRCVMLKLRYIKDALIKKYLMEQMEIPDYKADVCTAFAQGNMGKAITLATSEHFNEIKEETLQMMKYIKDMELPELLKALKSLSSYKIEVDDILDLISVWYRDVLLYKATKDINGVIFSDQMKYIKERANTSSYEGIETILKLLLLTIKEN